MAARAPEGATTSLSVRRGSFSSLFDCSTAPEGATTNIFAENIISCHRIPKSVCCFGHGKKR